MYMCSRKSALLVYLSACELAAASSLPCAAKAAMMDTVFMAAISVVCSGEFALVMMNERKCLAGSNLSILEPTTKT